MNFKKVVTLTLLMGCIVMTGCSKQAYESREKRQQAKEAHERYMQQQKLQHEREVQKYHSQQMAKSHLESQKYESDEETKRHSKRMDTLENMTPILAVAFVVVMGLLFRYLRLRKETENIVEIHRMNLDALKLEKDPQVRIAYLKKVAENTGSASNSNLLGSDS